MSFFLCVFAFVYASSATEVQDYPLLNRGDVRLTNLTDSSVVLTWTLKPGWEDDIMTNTSQAHPRLMIHLETDDKPRIYLTPDFDDHECSIALSHCLLTFLSHDTTYRVGVSMDNTQTSTLLGYDHVEFRTHSLEEPDRLLKKILLYVVLPGLIGLIVILFTLVIVCAKCCRCLCWRKREASVRQHPIQMTNQQEVRMSNLYDEAYVSDASMYSQPGRGYLPIMSEQHPPHPPHPLERHVSNDSTSSRHTHPLYPDSIISRQQQQLHQQQQNPHRPSTPTNQSPHHRMFSGRPSAATEQILDNDGYLDVVDVNPSHYANGLNVL